MKKTFVFILIIIMVLIVPRTVSSSGDLGVYNEMQSLQSSAKTV